jgi:hypothetical protein
MNDPNNISENAPGLESAGKVNPFTVPDGYFNELPGLISRRCQPELKDWRIDRSLLTVYRKPIFATVIVVVCMIATVILLLNHQNPVNPVNQNEVASYVMNEAESGDFLNGIDDSDIYSVSSGEINDPTPIADEFVFSTDEIIDYLLNENIDLETINQQ